MGAKISSRGGPSRVVKQEGAASASSLCSTGSFKLHCENGELDLHSYLKYSYDKPFKKSNDDIDNKNIFFNEEINGNAQQLVDYQKFQEVYCVALKKNDLKNLDATEPNSKMPREHHGVAEKLQLSTNLATIENIKNPDNKNESQTKFVPRVQKQLPFSHFSRLTKERLIVSATDLTKSACGAVKEFCRKTTAHGFSHVIEKRHSRLLKVFWFLVTVICLFAMANVAMNATYVAFVVRRPYSEVTYHDNRSHGMRLPDITVCDMAGFSISKMQEYNVSTIMGSYILIAVRGVSFVSQEFIISGKYRRTYNMDLLSYLETHNTTLSQLVFNISPTTECCNTLFRPVITSMGVCFTTLGEANTGDWQAEDGVQRIAGIMGGVKILFKNHQEEYMVFASKVLSGVPLSGTGVQVSLSFTAATPTAAINTHSFDVGPSVAASVAMQTSTLDKTESYTGIWPWSGTNCVTNEEMWQMSEADRLNMEDNQYWAILYRDCTLEKSNCTAVPFRLINDTTRECTPEELIQHSTTHDVDECRHRHVEAQSSAMGAGKGGTTQLCSNTFITQQLSYTALNISRVVDLSLKTPMSPSIVNIYHTQLGHTRYHQRVPTFTTWFSDLGGQMGLFMGASLITIIELVFTTVYVARSLCKTAALYLLAKMGYRRASPEMKGVPNVSAGGGLKEAARNSKDSDKRV